LNVRQAEGRQRRTPRPDAQQLVPALKPESSMARSWPVRTFFRIVRLVES
jgi:hypothetical protein